MTTPRHPTRTCLLLAIAAATCRIAAADDDDLAGLLKGAATANAPAPITSPDAPENKPTFDALGTLKPRAPADSRLGTITLNDGTKLDGRVWTTLQTALRLWIDKETRYLDIDFADLQKLNVHVVSQTMEDDWRWLKEGSDQKIYSGKKYPLVHLAYIVTLTNGQTIEGTLVAPIYFEDGATRHNLALNKKLKGELNQTLTDLKYITAITLSTPPATSAPSTKTTKLPLLDE